MFSREKFFKRTRRPENANSGVCFGGGNAIYVGHQLGHVDPHFNFYLGHRLGTIASKSGLFLPPLRADDNPHLGHGLDFKLEQPIKVPPGYAAPPSLGTDLSGPGLSSLSLHADNKPHLGDRAAAN